MERSKVMQRRRVWLRPNKSWGPQSSYHANVELEAHTGWGMKADQTRRSLYGTVGLRDCSDHISFDLNADSERKFEKHRKMLEKLISELQATHDAWCEGRDEIIRRGGWKQTETK